MSLVLAFIALCVLVSGLAAWLLPRRKALAFILALLVPVVLWQIGAFIDLGYLDPMSLIAVIIASLVWIVVRRVVQWARPGT